MSLAQLPAKTLLSYGGQVGCCSEPPQHSESVPVCSFESLEFWDWQPARRAAGTPARASLEETEMDSSRSRTPRPTKWI